MRSIGGKTIFRRTPRISIVFPNFGKKTWGLAQFYQASCQNCIFWVQEKLWGKFFRWKNYILIHLFRVFSRKKMTLEKLQQADCQDCIPCVNETLRGKINLLKKGYVLFIFFGLRLGKKLESSENFGKVVRAAFLVSSSFFEKKHFPEQYTISSNFLEFQKRKTLTTAEDLSAGMSNLHSSCPEQSLAKKSISRKTCIFWSVSHFESEKFRFSWNHFSRVVKTAFLRVHQTVWGIINCWKV